MSKKFQKKIAELSMAFDRYADKHPQLFDQIPYGGWVVMTDASDPKFSDYSRSALKGQKLRRVVEVQKQKRGWKVMPLPVVK